MTLQLVNRDPSVLEEISGHWAELEKKQVSADSIERMKASLQRWIDGGEAGRVAWGIFQFHKPP